MRWWLYHIFTTYFLHELMASWLHGRQEDSLSSCRGLMPKPPRRDEQKLLVDADKAGAKTRGRLLWGALKWMILPWFVSIYGDLRWFYDDLWRFRHAESQLCGSLRAHQGSTLWGRPCRWCRREWEPEICHRRLARGWQRGSRLARKSWIHLLQRYVTTEALRIPDTCPDTCSAQKSFYSFLWKNHEGSKSDIGLKKAYLRVVAWRCCPWRYPKLLFGDQFRRDPVASLPLGLGTEAAQLGALRGQVRQPLAEEEPGHGDVVQVWRAQFRGTVWDGRVTKGRS